MLPNVSHSSSHSVEHVPVLASEVAELLDLQPGDTVVDGTFGAGGHASVLEPQLRGHGCYIAIDRGIGHGGQIRPGARLNDGLDQPHKEVRLGLGGSHKGVGGMSDKRHGWSLA